jgi:hypothetical protein
MRYVIFNPDGIAVIRNKIISMLRKIFLLLDEMPESQQLLQQSVQLLSGSKQPSVTTAYLNGATHLDYSPLFDKAYLNNNQYTYADIVDKIYHHEGSVNDTAALGMKFQYEQTGARPVLYLDDEMPENKFISDARYHDQLVIGQSTMNHIVTSTRGKQILKRILLKSETPTLLLADNTKNFKNIVLVYDGSTRSMEAIKLFGYLMGTHFSSNQISLFTIINEQSASNERKAYDFIKKHRIDFSIKRVYENENWNELDEYLTDLNEFLLVNGASRDYIVEDIIYNTPNSKFLKGNRSAFIY